MANLKVSPSNLEAEQSVLGSIFIDKDALYAVYGFLKGDDFYDEKNRIVWNAIITLSKSHTPIDLLTVSDQLNKDKLLDDIGGVSYLAELSSAVPTASNISSYAKIVKDASVRRKMIKAGDKIMSYGYDEKEEINDSLEKTEKEVFSISQDFLKDKFVHIKDILSGRFDEFAEVHNSPEGENVIKGTPSGFKDIDSMLNGFKPSDLVVLAARPSMGKTALALNIAQNSSMVHGKSIGIFSLEMSKEQLVDRLFCSLIGVDSWKLHKGLLDDEDFQKLGDGMENLSDANIFIDDSVGASLAEVRAKARRLQMEHGLDLIIIDYLQLMSTGNPSYASNRVQEISEISRSLKALGRELHVPIIALSQLSRAVEQRPGKIPLLSDLRDSGSIEQDADVVLMLYREDYYEPDTERKGVADVFVRKNRNGPIGKVELMFKNEQMRFINLEKNRSEEILSF